MEHLGPVTSSSEQRRNLGFRILIGSAIIGLVLATGITAYNVYNSSSDAPNSPSTSEVNVNERYPVHRDIIATKFWVGEPGDETNDFIPNIKSAWDEEWMTHYGGVDDPLDRCDNLPCGFVPQDNPYYFALPYNDIEDSETGNPKSEIELRKIPWYKPNTHTGESVLENRWIAVTANGKAVYAQWKDVGPFRSDDIEYVFGTALPQEPRAGLDLSPAVNDLLGLDGKDLVDWRFVDDSAVPDGPWKKFVAQ